MLLQLYLLLRGLQLSRVSALVMPLKLLIHCDQLTRELTRDLILCYSYGGKPCRLCHITVLGIRINNVIQSSINMWNTQSLAHSGFLDEEATFPIFIYTCMYI